MPTMTIYTILDTTESGFDYIIVMCMDEFSDELEARCAQWDGAAMFVQLTYAGDTVIGVHEVFISEKFKTRTNTSM